MVRLAIIVSHPIQYYVPLYRRLAQRSDLQIKVFFTWHGADKPTLDYGFKKQLTWDIPLTEGYQFEIVPNIASDPGTHHFWGLRNPTLVSSVLKWKPDMVLLTGYAYASHLNALWSFHGHRVPVLFRGDSHLLNETHGPRWNAKRILLSRIFRWPAGCLYVGTNNREYFRAFGVPEDKLYPCPHCIEIDRFSSSNEQLERDAAVWRRGLGISRERKVILFAGKFEKIKRPVNLMNVINDIPDQRLMLLMVGDGELGNKIRAIAESNPSRFRVLPFQNQSRMPLVYRLSDLFVLPSASESWGLAVNEALACGRPVLVSDRVGCAPELAVPGKTGGLFETDNWIDFKNKVQDILAFLPKLNGSQLRDFARSFDVLATENRLLKAIAAVAAPK